MRVYLRAAELDFTTANLQNRLATKRILMCTPDYFDVTEAINEFMYQRQGDAVILNKVDRSLAVRQWNYLKDLYCSLGYQVGLVSGAVRPRRCRVLCQSELSLPESADR